MCGNKEDNKTIVYYNQNALEYANSTATVDFTDVQEWFLNNLPKNSYILDLGCGAGRDTKYFLEKGYKVDAIDGSEKLCEYASKLKQLFFDDSECWNL